MSSSSSSDDDDWGTGEGGATSSTLTKLTDVRGHEMTDEMWEREAKQKELAIGIYGKCTVVCSSLSSSQTTVPSDTLLCNGGSGDQCDSGGDHGNSCFERLEQRKEVGRTRAPAAAGHTTRNAAAAAASRRLLSRCLPRS